MKMFYTGSDMEKLATKGIKKIEIDSNVIITDVASEMARQLGIEIVLIDSISSKISKRSSPQRDSLLKSKPRGCQHGSLSIDKTSQDTPQLHNNSVKTGDVINELVDIVKHLRGQGE